jgi:hypothetical protein
VDRSLFQNCPPLFSVLRLTSPVPHAHVFRSSSTESSYFNVPFQALQNYKNKYFIPPRNNVNHTTAVCNTSLPATTGTVKSMNPVLKYCLSASWLLLFPRIWI